MVAGAGAAGLATAIFLRRATSARSVVILDGAKSPGAKILVSGGSRCNVTNVAVSERDFWGGKSTIVRRVLRALPVEDTIVFFWEIGIALHEEAGGKLFPDTNRSRDVLDALLGETARVGASLITDCRVTCIVPLEGDAADRKRYRIITTRGEMLGGAVVLATGGRSLPKSGSDGAGLDMAAALGHTIVPTTPALDPLLLSPSDPLHVALSGVSQDVELAVWIDGAIAITLTGAMLWTHFGVSGPVALNASRHWLRARHDGRDVSIAVNFCPGRRFEQVDARWPPLAAAHPRQSLETTLATMIPASVASALLDHLGLDGRTSLAHFTRDQRRRLSRTLVEFPLPVTGTRGYSFAEATAGGVALTEIDPATMESRVCPGLYLVGEMLDVDGRIGGFNFQWAWSSGFTAGRALSRSH